MKTFALSCATSILLVSLCFSPLAADRADAPAPLLTGKGHPILLKRMVVTATPLF